ncbi:hypothetical protein ACUOFU_16950 [Microbacterium arabinogalactanolyticum]|uniref:hypothetical protein n=1 Tax=Microbacterium arabinogalactanolyticum TaxID=69365 RepID=UPI004044C578
MRILTVRQPWAHAIIHQGKDVENRVRNVAGDYRGPIAIHAGLKVFDPRGEESQRIAAITGYRPLMMMPGQYGAIIGVVDLVGVHQVVPFGGRMHCETVPAPTDAAMSGACSSWADVDAYHLVLANPRPLAEPIPYKGALGLRTLDEYTSALVGASLAASALRKFADEIGKGDAR